MAPVTWPLKSRTGSATQRNFGIEFAVVDGEPGAPHLGDLAAQLLGAR